MKNRNIFILLTFVIVLPILGYTQITKLDNTANTNSQFVGWNSIGTSKTLDIMNNSSTPFDIDFYINSNKFLQVLTGGWKFR